MLLDEMLDRRLRQLFAPEVEAMTVRQRGWDGKKNGKLLVLAQGEFDAFLTMDRSMEHQQNLDRVDLAVILLQARSNRLRDTAPFVDEVKGALPTARPGAVTRVPKG